MTLSSLIVLITLFWRNDSRNFRYRKKRDHRRANIHIRRRKQRPCDPVQPHDGTRGLSLDLVSGNTTIDGTISRRDLEPDQCEKCESFDNPWKSINVRGNDNGGTYSSVDLQRTSTALAIPNRATRSSRQHAHLRQQHTICE